MVLYTTASWHPGILATKSECKALRIFYVRSAAYDCHLVSLCYRSERLLADAYHSFTWANELYASDNEGRAICHQ